VPKLPRLSGREVVKRLERLGFAQVRQRGSHVVLRKDSAEGTVGCVVPLHDDLAVGTLRGILRQAGVSAGEFDELRR
jgi:predicted RNA binding protein YcfA (HicA-like mRNA interferase family)